MKYSDLHFIAGLKQKSFTMDTLIIVEHNIFILLES